MGKDIVLFRAESTLVLELQRGLTAGERTWLLTTSLASREGTVRRHWLAPSGMLSDGQLQDMAHYVAALVVEAVTAVDGAQLTLSVGIPPEARDEGTR